MGRKRCEYCGGLGFNATYVNNKEIRSPCGACNGSGTLSDNRPDVKKADSGGCFVATAVYGSYSDPKVLVFRNFRDQVLKCSKIGNVLIEIYYFISPPIAVIICKSKVLRSIVLRVLLNPIFKILKDKYSS